MNRETHETTIRRWVANAWNKGNFTGVDALFDSGYVLHDPAGPVTGASGLTDFIALYRRGFPDLKMEVDDVLESDDRAAWRFTVTGTQHGEFMGIPATGRAIVVTGVLISRFEGDRWAEDWVAYDGVGMLRQLGVLETPAA